MEISKINSWNFEDFTNVKHELFDILANVLNLEEDDTIQFLQIQLTRQQFNIEYFLDRVMHASLIVLGLMFLFYL